MKPEDLARQQIDEMLIAAGWIVQDRQKLNLGAGLGVAIREFSLRTGAFESIIHTLARILSSARNSTCQFGKRLDQERICSMASNWDAPDEKSSRRIRVKIWIVSGWNL